MGIDYVYAVANIRANERKLLSRVQFDSMIDSESTEDISSTLADAGYIGTSGSISLHNYNEVLKVNEADLFNYITELSGENELINIFRFPADYHNIRVLLKSEFTGSGRNDILLQYGTISDEDMTRWINERNDRLLTENMGTAVSDILDNHARTGDPQRIDFICDKYCFKDITETAEKCNNDFVSGYVKLLIDINNLKTFVRLKKINAVQKLLESVFIDGGETELADFMQLADTDPADLADRFSGKTLENAAAEGAEILSREGSFARLELICDDILMDYISGARYVAFGIEPVIAYLLARQMEIKCIRILMAGKAAGMDPALIRERMRKTYE